MDTFQRSAIARPKTQIPALQAPEIRRTCSGKISTPLAGDNHVASMLVALMNQVWRLAALLDRRKKMTGGDIISLAFPAPPSAIRQPLPVKDSGTYKTNSCVDSS